ncbi:MAG: BON domain-containing protein [Planctomycetia bacterium]|nr:BON domain-containing protein [Planctomycetia bacterium]
MMKPENLGKFDSRKKESPGAAGATPAARDAAPITNEFADLFSLLPDARPGDVDTVVANIREDLPTVHLPEASLDDIKLQNDAPVIRQPAPPVSRPVPPKPERDSEDKTAHPPEAVTRDLFGEFAASAEDPFGESRFAKAYRQPIPSISRERAAVSKYASRVPPVPTPVEEPELPSLAEQILEHLEQSNVAAVSRLRIEVKNGDVVVAGEVPSSHERNLVAHYCRQHPQVRNFIDQMVVARKAKAARPANSATPAPRVRAVRHRRQLRLPFSARQIGAAAGLLLMAWTAYSYATRDGSQVPVYAVTGKVIVDGKPAAGAAVRLHPADRSMTLQPKGLVGADGVFTLTTYLPADGAPAGDYKLTVEWRQPVDDGSGEFILGPNVLPESYAAPAETPVRVSVTCKTEIPPIEIKP